VDTHLHPSAATISAFLTEHPNASIDVICEIAQRMRQTNLLVSKRAARNINSRWTRKRDRPTDSRQGGVICGSWTFINYL